MGGSNLDPCHRPGPARSVYLSVRTIVDFMLALLIGAALLPTVIVLALLIKIDSPGHVFFRQQRAGRLGKPFEIVKFRTMYNGSPVYSDKLSESDPRITRLGRLLRRTALDEIPQLVNVLKGEMALIGPRPEQLPLLCRYQPWQLDRQLVKPGITGWWQVHHRDSVPMYENVDKDLYYIEHVGPKLDLIIVAKTIAVMVGGLRSRPRGRRHLVESAADGGGLSGSTTQIDHAGLGSELPSS